MILPRFIIRFLKVIHYIKEYKDVQCEQCGEILGTFSNLQRVEWAVEQHYISKHRGNNNANYY